MSLVGALPRVGAGLGLLDRANRVAAELVAQRRSDLGRELDLVTRGETSEERGGEHRRRNAHLDRFVQRPAALAGVLDVGRDVVELRAVLLEGRMEQLEQPAADDGAVAPDA